MNNSAENPGQKTDGRRWGRVIAVLTVAGAVVAVALLLRGSKEGSTEADAPANPVQQGNNEMAHLLGSRKAETQTNLAPPVADNLPFSAERKALANGLVPLNERRKIAETLAEKGSDEALAALRQAYANGPNDLKVAIAESLGKCNSPECAQWLGQLLDDSNVLVARGAVRGLASQDTAEGASQLVRVLADANADLSLRAEIASALGSVEQPGVTEALSSLARSAEDDDLVGAALSSLGGRDFGETASFFKAYLQSPDVSSDLRVAAVESLAQAQGSPTDFLLGLTTDKDPEVRAAAAWAMSATSETGNAAPQLLDLLKSETDADVRLRMYQALRNQDPVDAGAALGLVQQEQDPSARVAGLDLLAKLLHDNPSAQLQNYFNQNAVPELQQIASSGQSYDDRQAAVIALTRARTPAAIAALGALSAGQSGGPPPR